MPYKDPVKKREYARKYWNEHPEMRADHRINKKSRKDAVRSWYKNFKKNLGCSHCPERHPACLTFHHIGDKEMDVARLVQEGYSVKSILAEIAKCIVLCANCHAKEHWGHQEEL